MHSATIGSKVRPNRTIEESLLSGHVEFLRNAWVRSIETNFICGLPGKDYELWTNVSLRMTILDAVREGRLSSKVGETPHLALARQIYRQLPTAIISALSAFDIEPSEYALAAARVEAEFSSAGIENSCVLVLPVTAMNRPFALLDAILGAAATESSVAFLSEIHRTEFESRSANISVQTPFGLTNIRDGRIVNRTEFIDSFRK